MWQVRDGFVVDDAFPCRHFVTTRQRGNARDPLVRQRACSAAGIPGEALVTAEQVHGTAVAVVDGGCRGQKLPKTDGLVTGVPGLPLAILTADCLPVFFCAGTKAAGIVHAGWRGIAQGIIPEAVRVFRDRFGIAAPELSVTIGPHIRECCFTAGDDVRKVFGAPPGAVTVDLAAVVAGQLYGAGVVSVAGGSHCTAHGEEFFFSYRRTKTDERMMSLIMLGGETNP